MERERERERERDFVGREMKRDVRECEEYWAFPLFYFSLCWATDVGLLVILSIEDLEINPTPLNYGSVGKRESFILTLRQMIFNLS